MPKPHRFVLDRVSGYAEEAAAFIRRRRHHRRPFARVSRRDGASVDHPAESDSGEALFAAAGELIELAQGKPERK